MWPLRCVDQGRHRSDNNVTESMVHLSNKTTLSTTCITRLLLVHMSCVFTLVYPHETQIKAMELIVSKRMKSWREREKGMQIKEATGIKAKNNIILVPERIKKMVPFFVTWKFLGICWKAWSVSQGNSLTTSLQVKTKCCQVCFLAGASNTEMVSASGLVS